MQGARVQSLVRKLTSHIQWGAARINKCVCVLCRVQLFVTPWTVARQAPLSMRFSRQKYCSGLIFPSPGDLPDPGIEPTSLESPTEAGRFFTTAQPGKPINKQISFKNGIQLVSGDSVCQNLPRSMQKMNIPGLHLSTIESESLPGCLETHMFLTNPSSAL